ncbi:MAG: toxin [Candidatus Binatia bacterium]
MRRFAWSDEKNRQLLGERGISFEVVLAQLERGDLLAVLEHSDPARFGRQKIFVVRIYDYAYLVPYVEEGDEIFLKTILPSRKATRDHLRPGDRGEKV